MACSNFRLPDLNMTSFVQAPQQPPNKCHVLHEIAIAGGQSFLLGIDPQFAFNVIKDTGLKRRRTKSWVWSKTQLYQGTLTPCVVEHECVRQHFEQSSLWFCLGVSRPLQSSLFEWTFNQLLNTQVLFLQLFRGERVAINRPESTERAVFCLHDSHDLFFFRFFFFLPVHPLGMILILEFQFIGAPLRANSLAVTSRPLPGANWASAIDPSRMTAAVTVAGLCISPQPMATSAHSTIW
jgi:hypothetical protein